MIRSGLVIEAINFSKERLNKFSSMTIPTRLRTGKEIEIRVDQVIALIAYMDPAESELSYLLDLNQREVTFDMINKSILGKGALLIA